MFSQKVLKTVAPWIADGRVVLEEDCFCEATVHFQCVEDDHEEALCTADEVAKALHEKLPGGVAVNFFDQTCGGPELEVLKI